MIDTVILPTAADAGVWVTGSHQTISSADAETIELAERYGRRVDDDVSEAIERMNRDALTDEDAQTLSFECDEAVSWLNAHVAPDGYSFYWHESDLGLWEDGVEIVD